MTNDDFKDSGEWDHGPQTPQAKQRVSDITTKHGAGSLRNALYGRRPFKQSQIDQINRIMILLQVEPREAIEFVRAASYDLVLRYIAATGGDALPSPGVMSGLRLATNLFETWDRALAALDKGEAGVLDLAELMQTK